METNERRRMKENDAFCDETLRADGDHRQFGDFRLIERQAGGFEIEHDEGLKLGRHRKSEKKKNRSFVGTCSLEMFPFQFQQAKKNSHSFIRRRRLVKFRRDQIQITAQNIVS